MERSRGKRGWEQSGQKPDCLLKLANHMGGIKSKQFDSTLQLKAERARKKRRYPRTDPK